MAKRIMAHAYVDCCLHLVCLCKATSIGQCASVYLHQKVEGFVHRCFSTPLPAMR